MVNVVAFVRTMMLLFASGSELGSTRSTSARGVTSVGATCTEPRSGVASRGIGDEGGQTPSAARSGAESRQRFAGDGGQISPPASQGARRGDSHADLPTTTTSRRVLLGAGTLASYLLLSLPTPLLAGELERLGLPLSSAGVVFSAAPGAVLLTQRAWGRALDTLTSRPMRSTNEEIDDASLLRQGDMPTRAQSGTARSGRLFRLKLIVLIYFLLLDLHVSDNATHFRNSNCVETP